MDTEMFERAVRAVQALGGYEDHQPICDIYERDDAEKVVRAVLEAVAAK